jgi:uncharacterized Zn finger protein (UPF0148 family)
MTFATIALGAALQAAASDPAVPTAIEHAIVEYQCRATEAINGSGSEADQKCYRDQLAALRTEFGRDLSRVTVAERDTLDATCGQFTDVRKRDAYVACLDGQLTSLRTRRSRGKRASATDAAVPAVAETAAADNAVPVPMPATPESSSSMLWIAGALATVILLAGAALIAARTRVRHKCRTCGAAVEGTGDLCPKCRHDAAEALRRAASQRTEEERADRERRRRLMDAEAEQRREQARQEEEARAREEAEARRQEEMVRERREEEARTRRQFGAADDPFDAHATLGVPRDASRQDIEAAYQAARQKYDVSLVEFLGPELQEHYKAKAAAVERAFKLLTE